MNEGRGATGGNSPSSKRAEGFAALHLSLSFLWPQAGGGLVLPNLLPILLQNTDNLVCIRHMQVRMPGVHYWHSGCMLLCMHLGHRPHDCIVCDLCNY
jgi:hypothetical protein